MESTIIPMKNKYVYRSGISEAKFREIVKLFSLDLEADQTAKITGLSRNTINKYYKAFRERIAAICELNSPLTGEIEVDESYFGARRVKGKRGRGAYDILLLISIFIKTLSNQELKHALLHLQTIHSLHILVHLHHSNTYYMIHLYQLLLPKSAN